MVRIRADVPTAELSFQPLDLADLDQVREAAEAVLAGPRIDVLINNAGVMIPPKTLTKQGYELQFGVNHLGTFALTALLLKVIPLVAGSICPMICPCGRCRRKCATIFFSS